MKKSGRVEERKEKCSKTLEASIPLRHHDDADDADAVEKKPSRQTEIGTVFLSFAEDDVRF